MSHLESSSSAVQVLVDQGIAALRQHNQTLSFDLLSSAIRLSPEHEQAWLWLSGATSHPGQRKFCLERVLELNPSSSAAQRGLALLAPEIEAIAPFELREISRSSPLPANANHSENISELFNSKEPASPIEPSPVSNSPTPSSINLQAASTTVVAKPTPFIVKSEQSQKEDQATHKSSILNWDTPGIILIALIFSVFYLSAFPNAFMVLFFILSSSGWVYIDATYNGFRRGLGIGSANLSPADWFVACLALWIVSFPLYLIKRPRLIALTHLTLYNNTSKLQASRSLLAASIFLGVVCFGCIGVGVMAIFAQPTAYTQTFTTASRNPSGLPTVQTPTPTQIPAPSYKFENIQVTWEKTARGFDDALWLPEVRVDVRNTGTLPTEKLYLQATFFDKDKVIKGDSQVRSVDSIPAAFAQGPIFISGSVGYTNDVPLMYMILDPALKWHYELSVSSSYFGPWTKVTGGVVELPPGYDP